MPVFGLPCQTANLWRIKILAQWCRSRHDEPPGSAMLNLTRLHLGIAHESQFQGLGINTFLTYIRLNPWTNYYQGGAMLVHCRSRDRALVNESYRFFCRGDHESVCLVS